MDRIVKVLHIIGLSFLGGIAFSLRKKYNYENIKIKEVIFNSFVNGMFGLTIGLLVGSYTDNIYFIFGIASLTGLYGDRLISLIFKSD